MSAIIPNARAATVCSQGCDFESIKAGIAGSLPGATLVLQTTEPFTESDILITQDLVIEGLDISDTILQAAEIEHSASGRVFSVMEGASLTLKNLTIRHGDAELGGAIWVGSGSGGISEVTLESVYITQNRSEQGAVYNEGQVTLRMSDISGNEATDRGAGLFNLGTVTVDSAWIRWNRANNSGGGIFNAQSGVINGFGLNVRNNRSGAMGGGIFNSGRITVLLTPPEANVIASYILQNSAIRGGGIYNDTTGRMSLADFWIVNNSARASDNPTCGGGIYSRGALSLLLVEIFGNRAMSDTGLSDGGALCIELGHTSIHRSVLTQNSAQRGGAVYIEGGEIEIDNSAVSSNVAEQGGGIHQLGGQVRVTSSTLIMNNAALSGGGVYYCGGEAALANTTIANNRAGDGPSQLNGERNGGGIWPCNQLLSGVSIVSTIVAGNTVDGGGAYPDCAGEFGSASFSLIENPGPVSSADRCGVADTGEDMIFDTSPEFAAYFSPGYLALAPTSPAIDAGRCQSALGEPTHRDQILQFVPTDGDNDGLAECDMGAFETNSMIATNFLFSDGFE